MTIGAGQLAAAADILAMQNTLAGKHYCSVVQTVSQNFTSGATASVTFDTELADADAWHSTSVNTDRITPNIAGKFLAIGTVHFVSTTTITSVHALVSKNGTAVDSSSRVRTGSASQLSAAQDTAWVELNGSTDYVTLQAVQVDSGATTRGTQVTAAQRPHLILIYMGP